MFPKMTQVSFTEQHISKQKACVYPVCDTRSSSNSLILRVYEQIWGHRGNWPQHVLDLGQ